MSAITASPVVTSITGSTLRIFAARIGCAHPIAVEHADRPRMLVRHRHADPQPAPPAPSSINR